jgi:hypothetical protein
MSVQQIKDRMAFNRMYRIVEKMVTRVAEVRMKDEDYLPRWYAELSDEDAEEFRDASFAELEFYPWLWRHPMLMQAHEHWGNFYAILQTDDSGVFHIVETSKDNLPRVEDILESEAEAHTPMTVRGYLEMRGSPIVPEVESILEQKIHSLTTSDARLLRNAYPNDRLIENFLKNRGIEELDER